jgi:hypothetical protein
VARENQSNNIRQEFGTEADVEQITGRKRGTLQKDRYVGRGFPFYRVGRKILYDLDEVREIVRRARVDFTARRRAPRPRADVSDTTEVP